MINVAFTPSLGSVASAEVWQYDYGQVLQIDGMGSFGTAVEVHFSTRKSGGTAKELVAVVGDSITVSVPDELLENKGTSRDYTIYAFVYPVGETSAETVARISIPVKSRPKPEYYEADPQELRPFDEIVAAVAADVAAAAASAAAAADSEQNASASEANAAESEDAAADSARRAAESAQNAEDSEDNAAASEASAHHWADLAQQGAEESGFAWFDINEEDGQMYVTVTANLAETTSFAINEETGMLEVIVNG